MYKRALQALKRTFMQVLGLPPSYFDNKTNFITNFFFNQNLVGEDLRHA